MRILLVEDDSRVASFISRGLKEENFTVEWAKDGAQGLLLAQSSPWDALILDWMLPGLSGMEVLQKLRAEKNKTPVLMLTAKDQIENKVAGLNAGADDYLTKPFGFEELLARIRAVVRRKDQWEHESFLQIADLKIDLLKQKVVRGNIDIELTNREYALLEYFMRHPGQVVTRTQLSENVWDYDFDTFSNVIDVHVARLRKKIDADFKIKLLKTLRGKGYRLEIPNPKK